MPSLLKSSDFFGKYDTYKGSTHIAFETIFFLLAFGKYDTYKGSTRHVEHVSQFSG